MELNFWRTKDRLTEFIFLGMAIAVPVILLIFVLYPVLKVSWSSIYDGSQLTLKFYEQLFLTEKVKLLWNTAYLSLLSTFCATLLGLILALGVVRSSWPGKKIFNFAAILHIISPPFVSAIVYIMLFGRRGFITNTLLGLDVNFIGWQAVFFLQTIGNASIAYLIIANVLKRLDRTMEKSALDLGASKSRVFFTITLPLLLPGITAAFLLVFTNILADFGTPILVGGGFRVLASEAYLQVISLFNMGFAAALCFILLVPCLSIIFLEKLILGNRIFTSSVLSDEGSLDRELRFHPAVSAALYLVCLLFALYTFTHLALIIIGTFTNIWGYDFTFSLRHMNSVWAQGFSSVKNSLRFAVQIAIFGPFLGMCAAYYLKRRRSILSKGFEFLSILPYAVPGPVMGIAYVMAFHHPPLMLTGTSLIIVIICMIRELPISFNAGKAVLEQVSKNLEQASRDLGANSWDTFTRVVLPLMAPAYRVGMIHAFIHGMITIGAIIFLITPRNKVLTFEIFVAINRGNLGEGAAFAFILIVMTVAGLFLLNLPWQLPVLWKSIRERRVRNHGTSPEKHYQEI
ncbi:ABC transporter permease [Candidatus Contubernalis alkaliaceticus]|uniref:ABC transporter permease n=1 Tax=Candidatus Contubernalis alkaliaceticus TaxID=338645 RepID=UPI001F4BFE18|nr:iron ABC transporter permease [Candidatus Contubernalis alkalaceticus]UNC90835.1 iron ABC transporter permease [Candidatus Contubernalis alkalaceticus]